MRITISEVSNFIMSITSKEDIDVVASALRIRVAALRNDKMDEFARGDEVEFTDKSGNRLRGVVVRFGKKRISVQTTGGALWRVPPSMFTAV